MKQEILNHLEEPGYLEKLYRSNKSQFKTSFLDVYSEHAKNTVLECWNERLNYESNNISWGSKEEVFFLVLACLGAGLVAKTPSIFDIPNDFFFQRNIGFVVFPFLTALFAYKHHVPVKTIAIFIILTLISLIYINLLPDNEDSDTLILSCLHLPLFLWFLLGIAFSGKDLRNFNIRLNYLRFNGDILVMVAILGISAAILSSLTFGLFNLIGISIEKFFQDYIIIFGLPAIPILATFLTQRNPLLVNKVSPIIAKIFSPIVLVMLLVYLVAIFYSGKDPYNDREFLLIFNSLLIGVLALIFFSVAEGTGNRKNQIDLLILVLLSVVTILVNSIALSAIIFRISEYGISPNRVAVLGSNVLILIHLLIIATQLFKTFNKKPMDNAIEKAIGTYLPVYLVWIVVVLFIFPLIFNFS